MASGEDERRRVRLERLHDHPARSVAPAPPGELRHELERALLGAEVGKRETGVRVDYRGDLDAGEVMSLRHHLRSDQSDGSRRGEAFEGIAQRAGPATVSASSRIRSSPGSLRASSASSRCVPGADPRELDGAAVRAGLGQLRRVAAVVAVEPPVAMQRQRDVAARAPASRPARAAVDRARDPAPVEEEDRAAASLRTAASSASNGAESGYPASRRRSTSATDGSGAPMRAGSWSRSSRAQLSARGVALP